MTSTTFISDEATTSQIATSEVSQNDIIKTDRLGRILVKAEHREALLDKFDQGSISAQQFAKLHGIKYTTFASWRQKRQAKLEQYPEDVSQAPGALLDSLSEVVVSSQSGLARPESNQSTALRVDLGGGVSLKIEAEADLKLAAKLIQQLRNHVPL